MITINIPSGGREEKCSSPFFKIMDYLLYILRLQRLEILRKKRISPANMKPVKTFINQLLKKHRTLEIDTTLQAAWNVILQLGMSVERQIGFHFRCGDEN